MMASSQTPETPSIFAARHGTRSRFGWTPIGAGFLLRGLRVVVMALPKCGNCNTNGFECVVAKVHNYTFPVCLIQCTGCGSVLGVMPEYDAGVLAHANQQELLAIKQRLD